MLFYELEKLNADKFQLDKNNYQANWLFYYEQYSYLVDCLIRFCKDQYELNCTARATLFLIRHMIELLLKSKIQSYYLTTHNIEDLFLEAGIDKASLLYSEIGLDFNSEGDSLRYYRDKDEKKFDNTGFMVLTYKILEEYNAAFSNISNFKAIDERADYSKQQKWNLTFHLNEAHCEEHVKAEYENVITKVLELISNGKVDLNQCYLPVFFLIRHSSELALKCLIKEANFFSDDVHAKKIDGKHSLVSLFNVYNDYLKKIDMSKLPQTVQEELTSYREKTKKLTARIHEFDSNSQAFRFPFDKNGIPGRLNYSKYNFWNMVTALKDINAFLCFTNLVLAESGAHPNMK